MTKTQLLQFIFSGITLGCIYGLVALGFTIIFNTTGIVNFAQGDFVMFGAMFAATFQSFFHFPLVLAVSLSVVCVAMIGLIMERVLIHSLKDDPRLFASVMMTMGASIVFNAASLLIWGADPLRLGAFSGETPIRIQGATLVPQMFWIAGSIFLVMLLLILFFRFTWRGQGMLACSMNKDAAASMGINVTGMVFLSFIFSATIGGLGGTLVAPITMATHDMGGIMTLKGFTAAIIGGLGSVPGAFLGGIILGLVESLSCGIISSGYRDAIALSILVVVLMLKPSGITGSRIIRR
jgi:branched-chain amino acid transport system permease protein